MAGLIGAETRKHRFLSAPALLIIVIFVHVALFSGTAAGQTFISPHGGFSRSSRLCEVCHTDHEAPGNKLVRSTSESALCFTCHNGTGSNFNTEIQMNQNPAIYAMHPIQVNLGANNGTYNYTQNTTQGIAPPGPYNCSQCHNPHRDAGFGRLLRAPYDRAAFVPYVPNPDPYDACWACHNKTSVVNDVTFFNRHQSHINNDQASCSACHFSPHGVSYTELVRFNPDYVTMSPAAGTGPSYLDGGNHTGTCTLSCHGYDHNNTPY